MSQFKKKSIVFFHPDLGIGGAERLIVDAAVGLQGLGHKVTIFTSHCDPKHCFDEAKDGTLDVRVRPAVLRPPASLLGRFTIFFAILRQFLLLVSITLTGELSSLKPEVFILDQLSFCIPFLRWLRPDPRVLFYCHFPDQLLARGREKWWKSAWRVPFDAAEKWSMRGAERVLVNSAFTKGTVKEVFGDIGIEDVGIVYPCVPTKSKDGAETTVEGHKSGRQELWKGKKVLLSINRFERKKDVGLAIRAYAGLSEDVRKAARLVIAGGYDRRIQENVKYHTELISLAEKSGLKTATFQNSISAISSSVPSDIDVLFLLSIPSALKSSLLHAASLLVYTPSFEHFGIVPVEAMYARVPVLAANSGGPLETVVDGVTGWLRDVENVEAWTQIMRMSLEEERSKEMSEIGKNGHDRVIKEFTESKMADRFDHIVEALVRRMGRGESTQLSDGLLFAGVVGMFLTIAFLMITTWVSQRKDHWQLYEQLEREQME